MYVKIYIEEKTIEYKSAIGFGTSVGRTALHGCPMIRKLPKYTAHKTVS